MECRLQTQEFLLNTCVPVCQLLSLIGTKFTKDCENMCIITVPLMFTSEMLV